MGRKINKKRSFGNIPSSSPTASARTAQAIMPSPTTPQYDFSPYKHITADLKRIGIIVAGILITYALIILGNNTFSWF
jgi:hypothetical protein